MFGDGCEADGVAGAEAVLFEPGLPAAPAEDAGGSDDVGFDGWALGEMEFEAPGGAGVGWAAEGIGGEFVEAGGEFEVALGEATGGDGGLPASVACGGRGGGDGIGCVIEGVPGAHVLGAVARVMGGGLDVSEPDEGGVTGIGAFFVPVIGGATDAAVGGFGDLIDIGGGEVVGHPDAVGHGDSGEGTAGLFDVDAFAGLDAAEGGGGTDG